MKPNKKRSGPVPGTRSGPRARAFEERRFAEGGGFPSRARPPGPRAPFAPPGEREAGGRTVMLEADVARAFRSAEAVNEALRLVLRLVRVAGRPPGRPDFRRDSGPRGERAPAFASRGPSRPRFKEDE